MEKVLFYTLFWLKSKFSQIWCIKLYFWTYLWQVNTKLWINLNNICKYIVISSLIVCIQIVCGFDFFNKLLIILKFSQHQWQVKFWNNCFLLLFLTLFTAHSRLETYVMRDDADFSQTNCLRVSLFQQKPDHF